MAQSSIKPISSIVPSSDRQRHAGKSKDDWQAHERAKRIAQMNAKDHQDYERIMREEIERLGV